MMLSRAIGEAIPTDPRLLLKEPVITLTVGKVPCVADVVLTDVVTVVTVAPDPGVYWMTDCTSQSPAVSEIEVAFVAVVVVMAVLVPVADMSSPTLPAVALLPFVTPTIFGVVIVGEFAVTAFAITKAVVAICVVFVPSVAVGAAGVPVKVGDASGAYPVAQPNPDALVHVNALPVALQLGIGIAVGEADDAVAFATTVFAACAARLARLTLPVAVKVPLIATLLSVARPCDVTLLNVGDG